MFLSRSRRLALVVPLFGLILSNLISDVSARLSASTESISMSMLVEKETQNTMLRGENTRLRLDSEKMKAELDRLEIEKVDMKAFIEKQALEIKASAKFKAQLAASHDEIDKLKQNIDFFTKEVFSLKAQVTASNSENEQLKESYEIAVSQESEVKSQLDASKSEADQFKESNEKAAAIIEKFKSLLAGSKKKCAESTGRIQQSEKELTNTREESVQFKQAYSDSEKIISKINAQLSTANSRVESLTKSSETSSNEVSRLKRQLFRLEKATAQQQSGSKSTESASTTLAENEELISQLKSQLHSSRTEVEQLKSQLQSSRTEIQQLTQHCEVSSNAVTQMKNQLVATQKELAKSRQEKESSSEISEKYQNLEKTVSQLQSQVVKLTKRNRELVKNQAIAQHKSSQPDEGVVKNLIAKLAEFEKENKILREKFEPNFKKLIVMYQGVLKQKAELEVDKKNAHEKLSALQIELELSRKELESTKKDFEELDKSRTADKPGNIRTGNPDSSMNDSSIKTLQFLHAPDTDSDDPYDTDTDIVYRTQLMDTSKELNKANPSELNEAEMAAGKAPEKLVTEKSATEQFEEEMRKYQMLSSAGEKESKEPQIVPEPSFMDDASAAEWM